MEPNINELKDKRQELLKDILVNIKEWDKTYEGGIEIIDNVEFSLGEIQEINSFLNDTPGSILFDEAYEKGIVSVRDEYRILLDKLEIEKEGLLQLIKETRLRDKVKDNYILKDKESIFIDKDL